MPEITESVISKEEDEDKNGYMLDQSRISASKNMSILDNAKNDEPTTAGFKLPSIR